VKFSIFKYQLEKNYSLLTKILFLPSLQVLMKHFKALKPPETVEVNKKTTFVSAVPAKVIF
jgi:hypothetical protein